MSVKTILTQCNVPYNRISSSCTAKKPAAINNAGYDLPILDNFPSFSLFPNMLNYTYGKETLVRYIATKQAETQ